MERVKEIRAEMLRKLKEEIRKLKATEVIVVGYFKENLCSKNMQEFIVEMHSKK